MQIGDRIRELRIDRDMPQREIANILQTSQSYYSEYELNKRQLPIDHLKTLCLYYNVSADYILGLPRGLNWPRG